MFLGWLRGGYFDVILPQRAIKYVFIYLNDDTLKPEVRIGTPGHAVLNKIQWFILATIKSNIPKNEKHELDDNQHTLSVYCGRYIRIKSVEHSSASN